MVQTLPALPYAVKHALSAKHKSIFAPWDERYDLEKDTVRFDELSLSLGRGNPAKRSRQGGRVKTRQKLREERAARAYENVLKYGPREVWKTLKRQEILEEKDNALKFRGSDDGEDGFDREGGLLGRTQWAARRSRLRRNGGHKSIASRRSLNVQSSMNLFLSNTDDMSELYVPDAPLWDRDAAAADDHPAKNASSEPIVTESLPVFMKAQSNYLRDTYTHAVRDERTLRDRTRVLMDEATKGLPLSLQCKVFSLDEMSRRILERFARIVHVKFISRAEHLAWKRWTRWTKRRRLEEMGAMNRRDRHEQRASRVVALVERIARAYEHRELRVGFSTWQRRVRRIAFVERDRAVRVMQIQKQKMMDDLADMKRLLEEETAKRKQSESRVSKLEREKEKRQKMRTAIKRGYRDFKMKFMFGQKLRMAQKQREEEYLRETVLDRDYTKDQYKGDILKEFEEDRTRLRHETFLEAKKDKERLKREELAAKLNDEGEGGLVDEELFG